MRYPLATDLKVRTAAPDKDARQTNAYIEVKGDQSVVRKRPCAQGGVAVGTGTAQGGIGLNIAGVDYIYTVNGDVGALDTLTTAGTTWDSGTAYFIGDHVSIGNGGGGDGSDGFSDYWALTDNTNSSPANNPSDWSRTYVPADPRPIYKAVNAGQGLTAYGRSVSEAGNAFISIWPYTSCSSTQGPYLLYYVNSAVVGYSVMSYQWTLKPGGTVVPCPGIILAYTSIAVISLL